VSTRGRAVVAAAVVVLVASATTAAVLLSRGGNTPATRATAPTGSDKAYARGAGATTLAGTGVPGVLGDGGAAVEAQLRAPTALAVNASGDLFVADSGSCRVREVAASAGPSFGRRLRAGEIVTVAGSSCGRSGTSPAPSALAVDPYGDLFIAYGPAARVEELPASTTDQFGLSTSFDKLVTVAGNGVSGFAGDGGSAKRSQLDDPTGLAVDAQGDLLIADTANCRLRLVAASTGSRFGVPVVRGNIYTVAGNGTCGSAGDGGAASSAELWDPGSLAVDSRGDVLVADQGNRSIRELASHSGEFFGVSLAANDLGTVAGEGSYGPYLTDGLPALGEVAEINFPAGIGLDSRGDLYIADGPMHAIRFVPATATTLRGKNAQPDDMYTAAGAMSTGPLDQQTTWVQTRMLEPTGLAFSSGGELVFSDSEANVVRQLPPGS
jgi:NHL repeat